MMEVAVKDSAGQEERKQQAVTVSRDLLVMDVVPEGASSSPTWRTRSTS